MKVLVYEWNGFCQKDLRDALTVLGYNVERIGYVVREKCEDAFLEEKLSERLKKGYDFMISFNFYPSVAKCCKEAGIPYLSWIYDGEDMGLYHSSVFFDTNYIFSFDSAMVERLRAKGVEHIYFMPLGVNIKRLDAIPFVPEEQEKFQCDISFIGNLYLNKKSLDSLSLSDYAKGYIEGILKAQVLINFSSLMNELLTPKLVDFIEEQYDQKDSRYDITKQTAIQNLMATSITIRERFYIMRKLSEHYPVDLYTYSLTNKLPKVQMKGVAGYFTTMPLIFRYSKINLNITHRMIQTGVPLRIMDILGAGGFLFTNYQKDMEDRFQDGEHLVIYYSAEDLIEKVGFYLKHEQERKRIAHNGHKLVGEEYTMDKLLSKMFQIAGITA